MINDDGMVLQFARLEEGEWQRMFKSHELTPEKKLFLAVLEDGFKAFEENITATSNKRRALFNETKYWFNDRSVDWLFSFENVCHILDFDPQPIRRQLDQIVLKLGTIAEVRDGRLAPASIGRPAQ